MDEITLKKYQSKLMIDKIFIPELNEERDLYVYLPSTYGYEPLPVLYMFDAQNMHIKDYSLSGDSWEIPRTIEKKIKEEGSKGYIVVGVASSNIRRSQEYAPYKLVSGFYEDEKDNVALADLMLEFYTNELKEYVDLNYKTLKDRDNTHLFGSSFGANISLYGLIVKEEHYNSIGLFSLCLPLISEDFKTHIKEATLKYVHNIYIVMGSKEDMDKKMNNMILDDSKFVASTLNNKNQKIYYEIVEGAKHTEKTWARSFDRFINIIES